VSSGAGPVGLEIDEVLSILSRSDDADLREIVELVANICGSLAAGITVRRGAEYHVPIALGIAPFVFSADDTVCQLTLATETACCAPCDPDGSPNRPGRPLPRWCLSWPRS
jgi:hypothetical protein